VQQQRALGIQSIKPQSMVKNSAGVRKYKDRFFHKDLVTLDVEFSLQEPSWHYHNQT
jgi:hypothetical protein